MNENSILNCLLTAMQKCKNQDIKAGDSIEKKAASGLNLPKMHGHTKITLRDAKTGKITDTREKDNLITDALQNIFANNIFGAINYADLTPLTKMLGGIMIFEDPLTANASNTMPPNDSDNKLIGHAGQTAYSGPSTKRGSPNGVLSGEIQGGDGYKFVFDFPTTAANGQISAISLTHANGGDLGLTPEAAITGVSMLTASTNKTKDFLANGNITFADANYFLMSIDIENETGRRALLDGDELTINDIAICLLNQGVNDAIAEAKITDTHTVQLTRSYNVNYAAVCCDDDYIYVVQSNSDGGSTLYIDKIDVLTWTATDASITDASLLLSQSQLYSGSLRAAGYLNRVIVSDGYLYWPKQGKLTYYKINLTNTADIVELTTHLEEAAKEEDGLNEINAGLIAGRNFIINGDHIYPQAEVLPSFVYSTYGISQYTTIKYLRDGNLFYCQAFYNDVYSVAIYTAKAYPIVYLATIQNITPIIKTPDKTMQIEYSITLEEP